MHPQDEADAGFGVIGLATESANFVTGGHDRLEDDLEGDRAFRVE